MQELSNWRVVWQCLNCTFKYKQKPLSCSSKENKCQNTEFIQVKVYCLDLILAYKAFMNIIIGGRRKGKTFAVAEYCVNKWLTERSKFVWTRRYKTEMKKALEAFNKLGYDFDGTGVYQVETETVLKIVRGKEKEIQAKKKVYIGTIVTVSTASRIRGGEFNDYDTLVIDEYGDEAGTSLKEEFTLINSLIVSIIDEKAFGICFVLSNNVNRFLPLYSHAGVVWDKEWSYNWIKSAVTHIVEEKDRKWIGASAKWLQSTDYYNYAVYNKPMDFDKQLIDKYKLEFVKPFACFKLGGIIKKSLRLIQCEENQWVIDECTPCNHEFYIIDDINKITYVKNINSNLQDKILQLYIKQVLKYTSPVIKSETRNWVARNLHLLEK